MGAHTAARVRECLCVFVCMQGVLRLLCILALTSSQAAACLLLSCHICQHISVCVQAPVAMLVRALCVATVRNVHPFIACGYMHACIYRRRGEEDEWDMTPARAGTGMRGATGGGFGAAGSGRPPPSGGYRSSFASGAGGGGGGWAGSETPLPAAAAPRGATGASAAPGAGAAHIHGCNHK
jgi:hypothetical protein